MTDPDTITQETWSPEYEDILANIAQSNQVQTPWHLLRNILKTKLRQNVSSSSMPNASTPDERPEDYQDRILSILDAFQGPPFTIQRLCELLTKPTEHHKTMIKYLRAMEKVVMVTSSFDEFPEPILISSITANGTASSVVAASESSLVSSSINITTEPTLGQIVFHHQPPSMAQDNLKDETKGGDEDVVVTDAADNESAERAVALETGEGSSAGLDELSSTATATDVNATVVANDEVAAITEEGEGVKEKPAVQPQQSEVEENKTVEQEKEDPMDMDG